MNNKFKNIELWSMINLLLISSFIGIGIYSIIKASEQDAYISVLLGGIIGIVTILIFIIIFNYEKDLPLNQKMTKLLGNFWGNIANSIFIVISFIMGISYMYNLIIFINSQFLNNTPQLLIGIVFSLVIIYANIKGLKTLTRLSFILIIINILLFLIPVIYLIPKANLENLKPILVNGFNKPFVGAFKIVLLNINNIFILSIIPKNKFENKNKTHKTIILSYITSIIIMFLIIFLTISSLGINLTKIYQYPEYIVLKKINLFNFLNRIENIIVLQWINGNFFSLSMIVYFISNTFKYENQSKILPTIITFSLLICSLTIFKNNTQFNNFIYYTLPYIRIFIILTLIIITILIIWKKRKNKEKILK